MEQNEEKPKDLVGLSELEIQREFLVFNEETQKWDRKPVPNAITIEDESTLITKLSGGVDRIVRDENGYPMFDENDQLVTEHIGPEKVGTEIFQTENSKKYIEQKKEVQNSMLVDYLANIDFTIIKKPEYKDEDELSEDEQELFQNLKGVYRKLVPTATSNDTPFDLLLKANPGLTTEELDKKFLSIDGFRFEEEGEIFNG